MKQIVLCLCLISLCSCGIVRRVIPGKRPKIIVTQNYPDQDHILQDACSPDSGVLALAQARRHLG